MLYGLIFKDWINLLESIAFRNHNDTIFRDGETLLVLFKVETDLCHGRYFDIFVNTNKNVVTAYEPRSYQFQIFSC